MRCVKSDRISCNGDFPVDVRPGREAKPTFTIRYCNSIKGPGTGYYQVFIRIIVEVRVRVELDDTYGTALDNTHQQDEGGNHPAHNTTVYKCWFYNLMISISGIHSRETADPMQSFNGK